MSRSTAQKRLHYVRAIFAQAATNTLEDALRAALAALPHMRETIVKHATLGSIAITQRDVAPANFVRVAVGIGVPDEAMSTLGMNIDDANDANVPVSPVRGRAFKLADAFCLIDGNDVLICTDGRVRIPAVNWYFAMLFAVANASADVQAFELRSRLDQDKAQTLAHEGVKEIKITSCAYAVTGQVVAADGWLTRGWQNLLNEVSVAMQAEVETDAQREELVNHLSELSVTTTIKVNGGSKADPVVIQSLEDIGKAALDEAPDGTDVTLITKKDNTVSGEELTLKTTKGIKRRLDQNDLDPVDAWNKLAEFREELINTGRWKE